jgi:dolichol-phosphate mannosyltransferase
MDGSVWVILPTYDEAENLEAVVGGIRAAVPDARILVVDDASRDGTGELADALAASDDALSVLHRPAKRGIGRAYTAGFTVALAAGAALVIEMDADLSHDPADLPRLIEAARGGADLVLGSRYAPGGGIENWGLDRRVLSRAGCAYARHVLGVDVRDLTGGFKCFRASALEAIDFPSAGAQGYVFQVELTWRVLRAGLRVTEVPIRFRERRLGASKMSARIAREAVWRVPALRFGPRRWRGLVPEAPSADPLVHEG